MKKSFFLLFSLATLFAAQFAYADEGQFQITSVSVDKVDAFGNNAEDVRSFGIQVSHPVEKITVSLWEAPNTSISDTPYLTTTMYGSDTLKSFYLSPGSDWFTKKLKPNTAYTYRVTAWKRGASSDMNNTYGREFTTSNFTASPPVLAVTFSEIHPAVTDTTATITWKTSTPVGGALLYRKKGSTAERVSVFDEIAYPATSHSAVITGLSPNTEYEYAVHAYKHNESGPDSTVNKEGLSFSTIAFSERTVVVTDTTATITWKTGVPSGGGLDYLKKQGVTQWQTLFSDQSYPQTTHRMVLTGLSPNTVYAYKIYAYIHHDDTLDTTATWDNDFLFQTKSVVVKSSKAAAPLFSDIRPDVTDTSATIQWKTNVASGGAVKYKKKGSADPEITIFSEQSYPQTEHRVALKGLQKNTEYTYTIHGYIHNEGDTEDTTAEKQNLSFSTMEVFNREVVVTDTTATITWKTGVGAGGGIKYMKQPENAYWVFLYSTQSYPRTDHSVTLSGLVPNATYTYQVYSYISNIATEPTVAKIEGLQFTTKPAEKNSEATSSETGSSFGLLPVKVDRVDALGKEAEDVRSFGIQTSHPFSKIVLSLWESPNISPSQVPYLTTTIMGSGTLTSVYVSPGLNWFTSRLKPNTNYVYRVTAYKYGAAESVNARQEGSFTTANFVPALIVDQQISDIDKKVEHLQKQQFDTILGELQQLRNKVKEQETELKYLKSLTEGIGQLATTVKETLNNFITYGVDANSQKLGAGERAAVAHSYKSAYQKLPETDAELSDMIKIANGRFPSERNPGAEKKAVTVFKQIYKRVPNLKNNRSDVAAIMVMAYGLRQAAENRNLDSERRGIATYKTIFGKTPSTTDEWNTMQAITYSGAQRKPDVDKDLLADEDEQIFGTSAQNPDSDGDGFIDGLELENYYNPLSTADGSRPEDVAQWLLPLKL